jgi:hypothetical protein
LHGKQNVAFTPIQAILYEKNSFLAHIYLKFFGCTEDLLGDDDRMGLERGRWNGWHCFAEPGQPGPLARLFDQALWPGQTKPQPRPGPTKAQPLGISTYIINLTYFNVYFIFQTLST